MTRWIAPFAFAAMLGCASGDGSTPNLPTDAKSKVDTAAEVEEDTEPEEDTATGEDTAVADTATDSEPADTATDTAPEVGCVNGDKEPNDDSASAVTLTAVSDCDGDGKTFSGTIAGPTDVDWFKFAGNDKFGCSVDPVLDVKSEVRVCSYVRCTDGSFPSVTCSGSTKTTVDGRAMCCASGPAKIGLKFDCPGVDDNADVFMRVDKSGTECTNYSIHYHY